MCHIFMCNCQAICTSILIQQHSQHTLTGIICYLYSFFFLSEIRFWYSCSIKLCTQEWRVNDIYVCLFVLCFFADESINGCHEALDTAVVKVSKDNGFTLLHRAARDIFRDDNDEHKAIAEVNTNLGSGQHTTFLFKKN